MASPATSDQNKPVIIVTGASRGIGLAIVNILLRDMNACVVAVIRKSTDVLTALANEYQGSFRLVCGDVVDPKTSQEAVKCAIEKWGRLDGIVLNAGVIEPMGTIASVTVDTSIHDDPSNPSWRYLFEVNFFSLLHTIQASLPELRNSKRARIVMVSSGSSVKGYYGTGPYGSSKAAMNSLTQTLAIEEPTITTLSLRPGPTDTDMQGQIRGSAGMHPSDTEHFKALHASNSLLPVDEAGHVLATLVLSAPSSMSGKCLSIDDEECVSFLRKSHPESSNT